MEYSNDSPYNFAEGDSLLELLEIEVPSVVPCPWKDRLRRNFEEWLDSLESIPSGLEEESEEEDTPSEEPDLYSFYEQLTLLQSELRRANRRTAEIFSQWNEILTDLNAGFRSWRESQTSNQSGKEKEEESLPRNYCLIFIELLDRLSRLSRAFQSPPRQVWWRKDSEWRKLWSNQAQAFDIFLSHFETLLLKEEINRIPSAGQVFDPTVMIAVAARQDSNQPQRCVLEEISAGFFCRGELLRPAQVVVNKLNQDMEKSYE